MTIAEAISKTDSQKPNRFSHRQKLEWLEYLEGQIYREMICTHDNPEGLRFEQFGANVDTGRELLAPSPYDEVYTLYLSSRIDLGNQEVEKYNNSKTLYNAAYASLRDYWKRTHMPIQGATHFKL